METTWLDAFWHVASRNQWDRTQTIVGLFKNYRFRKVAFALDFAQWEMEMRESFTPYDSDWEGE